MAKVFSLQLMPPYVTCTCTQGSVRNNEANHPYMHSRNKLHFVIIRKFVKTLGEFQPHYSTVTSTHFYCDDIMPNEEFHNFDNSPSLLPLLSFRIAGHHQLADRLIEMQYELADKLSFFLCGRKPMHSMGEHYLIPNVAGRWATIRVLSGRKRMLIFCDRQVINANE